MSFDFVLSYCVCKLNVDDLKGKKRHKKLDGNSCVAERSTLVRCVKERCGVSIGNIGLKDSKCVLCYQCTLILGKIDKEIEKLTNLIVKSFAQSDGEVNSDSAHASQERNPKQRKVIVRFS